MNLPTLTKEERALFDLFKVKPTTYEEVDALFNPWGKVKALCLQEDPFEAARFKWFWLAYGMEEGWLEKTLGRDVVALTANQCFFLETNYEFCQFCKLTKLKCKECKLQPYTGTGCEFVWDFWVDRNEPLPMLEQVLQASIDKEFELAKQACSLWKVIEETKTMQTNGEFWKSTPWLISLKTDRNTRDSAFHTKFTEVLGEEFGVYASRLQPQANWREGSVSVHGWVWFGFRTEAQMLDGKRIYESLGGKYV